MKKLHRCATYGCRNPADSDSDYCPSCFRLMVEGKTERAGLAKMVEYVFNTLRTCPPPESMHVLTQCNIEARKIGLKSYGELQTREWLDKQKEERA
jgi:hypothetical protein